MNVLKSGKQVFGAKLTNAEKAALEIEAKKIVDQYLKAAELNIEAEILWQLHSMFGLQKVDLRDFFIDFVKSYDDMMGHYELDDSDGAWMCRKLLKKEMGIDIEKWHEMYGSE